MAEDQEHEVRKEETKRRLLEAEREALAAIKADLAEWLSRILDAPLLTAEGFMSGLDTGVLLCRLAQRIQTRASELQEEQGKGAAPPPTLEVPMGRVACFKEAEKESFYARDNASNFISWCRQLGVGEAVLFESEGLVMHRDERRVVLCLLEVARRAAARLRLPTPNLIRMEMEMDQESVASSDTDIGDFSQDKSRSVDPTHHLQDASNGKLTSPPVPKDHSPQCTPSNRKGSTSSESSPPRKKARRLTQVDRDVMHICGQCQCVEKMGAKHIKSGKFELAVSGDKKMVIFARALKDRIMVRVGGGWDTLDHFLLRHDPCRIASLNKPSEDVKVTKEE